MEPVSVPPAAVEPENIQEQHAGEMEMTLPDETSETSAAVDREISSTTPESHEAEAAVNIQQSTDQANTEIHIGTDIGTETSDTIRRSDRTRRPPGRFHYPELGKPLISFAQSLLESFNRALDTINDYGASSISAMQTNVLHDRHEGTHAV